MQIFRDYIGIVFYLKRAFVVALTEDTAMGDVLESNINSVPQSFTRYLVFSLRTPINFYCESLFTRYMMGEC